jgi:prevent-host-death family protein
MGLFEVKNRFSEVCDRVFKTGEPCIVTRHGKPIVKVTPIDDDGESSVWDRVEERRVQYGQVMDDFDLPSRNAEANRRNPLEE